MSQFDLVEAYLTNRLDVGARLAFEQEMAVDSQLKGDVDLQKQVIEGIKKARATELKTMLNNVPISGGYSAPVGKIVLATISAGIIGSLLYFNMQDDSTENAITATTQESAAQESMNSTVPEEPIYAEDSKTETQDQKPVTSVIPPHKEDPKPRVTPRVEVIDPTEDLASDTEESISAANSTRSEISASSVEVETESGNKDYPFHYQFSKGKLHLFGPFDSALYEIIEINGGTHSIFLFYREAFYHLDQKESKIVPLIQIRDLELLDKLEQYRK